MLADARSLWSSASTAIANLNDNITTALENFEAENLAENSEKNVETIHRLQSELNSYKSLLDDAQMQHFELSKQSRSLVAEKEAEIQFLKEKHGEISPSTSEDSTGEHDSDVPMPAGKTSLKYKKLLAEKMVTQANLEQAEEKLRTALHDRNEHKVLRASFEDINARFEVVRSELGSLKSEYETKDREKNETIENLVGEYSKLAAESEVYQQSSDRRVQEVIKENEVLVTKMHALEHSISELADRATAASSPASHLLMTVSPSAASLDGTNNDADSVVSTSSRNASNTDLPSQSSSVTGGGASYEQDLKEARSKIVNLQFDVKEKDQEIERLRSSLAATVSVSALPDLAMADHQANISGGGNEEAIAGAAASLAPTVQVNSQQQLQEMERRLGQVTQDVENKSKDISRLTVEKREADEAGKRYHEQCRRLQQELDTLTRAHRQRQQSPSAPENSSSDGSANNTTANAATISSGGGGSHAVADSMESLQTEHAALQKKLQELRMNQEEQSTQQDALLASTKTTLAAEAASTLAESVKMAEDALKATHQTFVDQLQSSHQAQLQRVEAESSLAINTLKEAHQVELNDLSAKLAAQQEESVKLRADFDAQITLSSSDGDAQRAALESSAQQQLESQARAHAEAINALKSAHSEAVQVAAAAAAAATEAMELQRQQLVDANAEGMAAWQEEKSTLQGQLQVKEQELAKLVAHHEAQSQLAKTHAEDAKATMVDDHTAKMDALQSELEACQRTMAEKEGEFANALSSQEAKAAAALNDAECASAALLAKQKQESEELVANVKADHAEELKTLLEALKNQLTSAHETAQEQALAEAAAEASAALALQLQEQETSLELAHAETLAAASDQHEQAQRAAVEATTAQLTQEKEQALAAQAETEAEARRIALQLLGEEKDAERVAALDALRAESQQALDRALTAAAEQAEAVLTAAKEAAASRAAELNNTIDQLNADLLVVEEKHQAITKDALAEQAAEKDAERNQALVALRAELQGDIDTAYRERDEHLANYTKERKLRKKIHNRLLEIQGNIRVLCRVRPVLEVERRSGEDVDVTDIPNDEELFVQRDAQARTRYEYDRVFAQTSNQEEVFEAVQPLCISVMDGYNVCIFAYGQTGSGKTFTMEGSNDNKGVSPRAIGELLTQTAILQETHKFTITMSMLEIYNETILDLLGPANTKAKLDIRQTGEGNQVVGLSETEITTMDQVAELMKRGQKNRAVGSHDMNEHSSRSHSIITLVCRGENKIDQSTTYGKLHLIDLAGSERVGKTDATGDRLKEAQNINKSLSALGEVINALGNKKSLHVPYRNSKLTFLLQDSLGGNSKVLMFVNISPAVYNLGETVCSLNFATRCRSTELGQAKKQSSAEGDGAGNSSSSSKLKSSGSSSKFSTPPRK